MQQYEERKYNNSLKKFFVLLTALFSITVVIVLYLAESNVKRRSVNEFENYIQAYAEQDDDWIKSYLDSANIEKYIVVSGWIFEEQDSIVTYECHVALENKAENTVYVLPTEMQDRQDVCDLYGLDSGYIHCGYLSKVKKTALDIEGKEYEIIILYENNGNQIYYHTNIFIRDGKIA